MALKGHVNMAAYMRHVRLSGYLLQRSSQVQVLLKGNRLHSCCGLPKNKVHFVSSIIGQSPFHIERHGATRRLLQHTVVCGVLPTRWNSTENAAATPPTTATTFPEGYIPEPPPIPVPEVPVDLPLNALGEPTLQALGLAHWTPPGFIQSSLEFLHVSLDLPWWGAIVAGTIVLRTCVFPLVIMAQRNAAQMHNHMPTIQRLQEKFTKTRTSGNVMEAARVANELQDYMKRNKVRPGRSMMVPLAQAPIFISVFLGVRAMANLPVESMKMGGMLWFTDLTIPDPYFALPLITMTTLLVTLELGVDGVRAQSMSHTIKWVMRGMPIVMFPLVLNFPSALLCYWVSTNAFSLVQVMMLKIPQVREFFKIPALVAHPESAKPPKKGFVKGFKETWNNSKVLAELEDRQRMDAVRWKESAEGPIQKTYKYDPTKSKRAVQAKPK